jgi:flagellar biosynthesis/type III secretory pathway chaperone
MNMVTMHGIFVSRFLDKKTRLVSDSNRPLAKRSVNGGSWLIIFEEKQRMMNYISRNERQRLQSLEMRKPSFPQLHIPIFASEPVVSSLWRRPC